MYVWWKIVVATTKVRDKVAKYTIKFCDKSCNDAIKIEWSIMNKKKVYVNNWMWKARAL